MRITTATVLPARGATQTAMDCPIFLWSTISAVPSFIAITAMGHSRLSDLNADNDRYSFACAWGDSNGNGLPDLFVVNDFGSSQLYRNNGNGTFAVVSHQANVEGVGAGMSCAWCDYDNDGHQDVYVPSMWEAAGQRVSEQK